MRIPLFYTWRSLWTRRVTTLLTLGGFALVVFVFAAVLMLANGLQHAMVETGSASNAIVVRKAATSEVTSQISRDAVNILETHPEVARLPDGKPVASAEVYVLINLAKKGSGDMGNITVRGVSPGALALRPEVHVTSGRMFTFGTNEIVVGRNIADRFEGCEMGKSLRFGGRDWTIVGLTEAGRSAFESEIWGDLEEFLPAFGRRTVLSSLTLRLRDPNDFAALKSRIAQDPRTQAYELKLERSFYREQSEVMAKFIRILGMLVTIIFSVGAMIGAMITMYAAVANRTVEVGTLRALGFRRRNVLGAFLIEAVVLALLGAGAGVALAAFTSFIRISTMNWGTFSELAFGFVLSPVIILSALFFGVIMGVVGGFLPSVRAARLDIVTALRVS
jgi:putative ABC transport system permease protein